MAIILDHFLTHAVHRIGGRAKAMIVCRSRPQAVLYKRLDGTNPVVLYGVEFVFCRDEIKPTRGADREKAAKAFVAEVDQGAAKVAESMRRPGFMRAGKTLAFVKGTGDPVVEMIRRHVIAGHGDQLDTAPRVAAAAAAQRGLRGEGRADADNGSRDQQRTRPLGRGLLLLLGTVEQKQ